ncbi:MAG TPA: SHOCT domain-containing protein [Actinomycetes bacterium]|jgi:putative membrane protein|nr:SHOCT domain-containing protein [Actinomycetes bacterium]
MTLTMLVFWGGLIALAVWAFRSFGRPPGPDRPTGPPVDALAILEARFARGEIDQEEFERRRDVLRGARAVGGR